MIQKVLSSECKQFLRSRNEEKEPKKNVSSPMGIYTANDDEAVYNIVLAI